MCGEKQKQIIDSVLKMTDSEADLLAVFRIMLFVRAGRQTREREAAEAMQCTSEGKTA